MFRKKCTRMSTRARRYRLAHPQTPRMDKQTWRVKDWHKKQRLKAHGRDLPPIVILQKTIALAAGLPLSLQLKLNPLIQILLASVTAPAAPTWRTSTPTL